MVDTSHYSSTQILWYVVSYIKSLLMVNLFDFLLVVQEKILARVNCYHLVFTLILTRYSVSFWKWAMIILKCSRLQESYLDHMQCFSKKKFSQQAQMLNLVLLEVW